MHLGPFGCLTEVDANWDELVQKFVPRSRVGIFRNKSTRSTPWDPELMFWCISCHLDPFGTVRLPYDPLNWSLNSCVGAFRTVWVYLRPFGCLTKLGAKHSELVQKFVPRSHVGIFNNKSTRSTPWDPKLMFWFISYHLDPFRTVRLPDKTRGKTGRTRAKVRATKSRRNGSQ